MQSTFTALAQNDTLQISVDTSSIKEMRFSDELSRKYNETEFDYDTVEGETQNLLARIFNWFFKGLQEIFGIQIPPEVQKLLETLIYILLLIAASYFIIRLLAGKEAVSFFRNKNRLVAPVHINEEDIENINLDQQINDALADKDYRLAIRFMYLKALKELSLRNLISFHFEKTNNDYYREIVDTTLKQNFNNISYLYDYIWYGEFELDEPGFERAKRSFDQLTDNIKSSG